jgi:TRAP-type mannitol/chloroaromatic compound transport system permease small subunit
MADLFTTNTAHILKHFLTILFLLAFILVLVFFIVPYYMFTEFASWLFFTPLATAPPHLSTPIRLMHSA